MSALMPTYQRHPRPSSHDRYWSR